MFREQVRLHSRAGVKHLYIFGTAGEGYAVTESLFDGIVAPVQPTRWRATRSAADDRPHQPLDADDRSSASSAAWTAACGRSSSRCPAGARSTTTSSARSSARSSAGSRQAQFLHYNLQRAGRVLGPAEYARLAAQYPNLVGAKNGTSNIVTLHDLLTQAPAIRQFYTELGYPQGCMVGEPGYLMSLTTMNPWLGVRFFEAGVDGDAATLFGIQAESLELFELLVGSGGAEVGIAGGSRGRKAAHGRRLREGAREGPRPADAAAPAAAIPVGERGRVQDVPDARTRTPAGLAAADES